MKPCVTFIFLAVLHLLPLASAAPAARPNIVLIYTDDQRYDAVGYAGNPVVRTPNLDKLAKSGVVFRNCFVNTSICAISRANILSGQYPSRHGIDDFHKEFSGTQLSDTVPALLRESGYQTAFFGKWGIGDSPEKTHRGAAAFDYWAGQPMQTCFFHQPDCRYVRYDGFSKTLDDLCDCPADSRGKVGYRNRIGAANLRDPLHMDSEIIPMQAARFLEGRDYAKPFCMMLFFKSPHSPVGDFDPAVKDMLKGKAIPKTAAGTLENAMKEPEIIRKSLGWPTGNRFLRIPPERDRFLRDYYRSVSSMDLGVGRIMEELGKRGLAENTVVLFTSDNGYFECEHGLSGKWLMYEPSLRVPGFMADPRRKGGKLSDRLVITTDFSATMLDLAGLPVPERVSGMSLSALAENAAADWRKDFYYEHPYAHNGAIPTTVGVRSETMSYTRYTSESPAYEQLFDLTEDPDQLSDLARDPAHSGILEEMRKRCRQLAAEVGAIGGP
ncbi:sulfatase-like hydrolase/transferase [Akkermansiaceae bacterium]|nr:sulfatase-like hydrolase/transferase [Akkermansiaceae bacterium]